MTNEDPTLIYLGIYFGIGLLLAVANAVENRYAEHKDYAVGDTCAQILCFWGFLLIALVFAAMNYVILGTFYRLSGQKDWN